MKWSEGLSNMVSIIVRRYEVCCLYGLFVYHILSCSFGSILYHCVYGCMFCVFLFNSINYVFLLLCLCVLIVMFMYYCYVRSVLGIPFHCFLCIVCKCVLYYCHRVSNLIAVIIFTSDATSYPRRMESLV